MRLFNKIHLQIPSRLMYVKLAFFDDTIIKNKLLPTKIERKALSELEVYLQN